MKKFICAAVAAVCAASAFAFGGCSVGEAHVEYTLSEDGAYYIVSGVSGDKRGLSQFTIPATYSAEEGGQALPVREIGDDAFFMCYYLKSVTIPDTITRIGKSAFAYCNLSSLEIPDSVATIDYGAFGSCTSLTEVTIPESVTQLSPLAFAFCSKLETAYVKANIATLSDSVFYNRVATQGGNVFTDTSLAKIYLPASLERIHINALYGNVVSDIYFEGTEDQWNKIYFYEMVKKEGTENEYEEKKYKMEEMLSSSVAVHYGINF